MYNNINNANLFLSYKINKFVFNQIFVIFISNIFAKILNIKKIRS